MSHQVVIQGDKKKLYKILPIALLVIAAAGYYSYEALAGGFAGAIAAGFFAGMGLSVMFGAWRTFSGEALFIVNEKGIAARTLLDYRIVQWSEVRSIDFGTWRVGNKNRKALDFKTDKKPVRILDLGTEMPFEQILEQLQTIGEFQARFKIPATAEGAAQAGGYFSDLAKSQEIPKKPGIFSAFALRFGTTVAIVIAVFTFSFFKHYVKAITMDKPHWEAMLKPKVQNLLCGADKTKLVQTCLGASEADCSTLISTAIDECYSELDPQLPAHIRGVDKKIGELLSKCTLRHVFANNVARLQTTKTCQEVQREIASFK